MERNRRLTAASRNEALGAAFVVASVHLCGALLASGGSFGQPHASLKASPAAPPVAAGAVAVHVSLPGLGAPASAASSTAPRSESGRPREVPSPEPAGAPSFPMESQGGSGWHGQAYVARKWLDVGPSPVHPPDISLDAFAPTPAFAFRAFVYIDESGRVTGLEFEGDVPPEMAALIRRRFLETRFTPGLVKGVPVRCWTTFEFRVE